MSNKASVALRIGAVFTEAPAIPQGSPSRFNDDLEYLLELAEGTGDKQYDAEAFSATYDIVAGAVQVLELDALSSGDITLSKVKLIAIKNRSAADEVTIGGGTGGSSAPNADAWSDTDGGVTGSPFSVDGSFITIPAQGMFLWAAPDDGVDVVNTTAQILGIEAFTSTQTIDVLIIGLD